MKDTPEKFDVVKEIRQISEQVMTKVRYITTANTKQYARVGKGRWEESSPDKKKSGHKGPVVYKKSNIAKE